MRGKKTIALVTPNGVKQVFELRHAERLLAMGPIMNGGWAIDKNEKYYFDKENGIRLKTDKANTAKA